MRNWMVLKDVDRSRAYRAMVLAILVVVWTLPARAQQAATGEDRENDTELREVDLEGFDRLHAEGHVYLGSQPSSEALESLGDAGVRHVINLREPDEMTWDEEAAVRENEMEYHHFPFRAPDDLTDDLFDDVREVLREAGEDGVLVHCASANRVGAVWLAHRVLDDEIELEQAEEEARKVGLRTPAYLERAREYIREQQGDDESTPQPGR